MEHKDLSFFRDILVVLCLDDDNMVYVNTDQSGVLIAQIVNMMHTMRKNEAEIEADDWVVVGVPCVSNPQKFFDKHYRNILKSHDIEYPLHDSESDWPDFWPVDCKWHPTELKKLAETMASMYNLI